MDNRQVIYDYVIEHIMTKDALQKLYPNFKFYEISPRVSHIQVPDTAIEDLDKLQKGAVAVYRPVLLGLNISEALAEVNILPFQEKTLIELTGKGTMIGFIDTGIQYTNKLFQYEDGTTRIKSLWDQSVEGKPPIDQGFYNYDFGSIYTEEDINNALAAEDPYSIVPSKDTNGHGTYLAGIAAGKDRSGDTNYTGGAPDADLVVVKLREAQQYLRNENLLAGGVPAYQSNDVMEGINYAIKYALNRDKQIAICLAVGSNYGPHNGSTVMERFLNDKAILYDVIIVSSAGNEGNLSSHYSDTIKQGGKQEVEIYIPEGENGFILNLWATSVDKIAIGFKTPLGNSINEVPIMFKEAQTFSFNLEKSRVSIDYDIPNLMTGVQSIEMKCQHPTPGIWTVYVYGKYVLFGDYNIWLQREGFIKEETKFIRPKPEITVCTPSTAEKIIVVGNYNMMSQSVYPSSGRGPTTNAIIKPDIVAPGVNVPGPDLVGGYTTKTGTGAATALTAAACALLLQWAVVEQNFNIINTNIARTILIRGAKRKPNVSYPNLVEGYGELDLKNSIQNI